MFFYALSMSPHPHGAINKTHISRSPVSAPARHHSLLEVGVFGGGGGGRGWLSTCKLIAWRPTSSHRERGIPATVPVSPGVRSCLEGTIMAP